jgi:hypothetical protein
MHVGLLILKEVDALDGQKTILTEKKFFEMECQVLDLGQDKEDTSKQVYAIHFHYPHNDEPISGLRATGYVDTFEDE